MTYDKKALQELKGSAESNYGSLFDGVSTAHVETFSQQFIDLSQKAHNGSLDAAISLLEAVLPGWAAKIDSCGFAGVYTPTKNAPPDKWHEAQSETPSRALLLAILSALIEGEGE